MKRKLLFRLCAVGLMLVILIFLQRLFMPKYMSEIPEGNMVAEYYEDTSPHDVIFIGDCEVFSNISPITLWENYGITSYIRGSAQQLIWQSYYLLEDALRYEKPKAVVFNVLAMKYNEPQKEAYNRLTLDGMKLSKTKINAIKASMTEEEELITYIFPLLRYHTRWKELSGEDFKYLFGRDQLSHNGYLMRVDAKPVSVIPTGKKLANYQFGDNSYDYLDRITKLCKDNDIELILMKSPSVYPYWYEEWDDQMLQYAADHDLTYYNFLANAEEIGIDYQEDTFDGGLHMNLSGAVKLSDHLGSILSETYLLEDHREDPKLKKLWDKKVAFYEAMREDQFKELEEFGYLKSYGAKENTNGVKENTNEYDIE